jgi:Ni/Fe-hydrogenase subunit HybB-like protein
MATGWGAWYGVEIIVLTLLPALAFLYGFRKRSVRWIRAAAIATLIGVVMNRMNVSIIAFRWDAPVHYVPTWMEVVVAVAVICAQIWVFRWVINRMPVLDIPLQLHDRSPARPAGERAAA